MSSVNTDVEDGIQRNIPFEPSAIQEVDLESAPTMISQPEARPISPNTLAVEVDSIYAGLFQVEATCIEMDEIQGRDSNRKSKLTDEQWEALIAVHKQLLLEHHDFFLASQHPLASAAVSRLPAAYSMPARMWRHGIGDFLKILLHRLPESLDHMRVFISIAYSTMTLFYETVTTFKDTWIECLGDLARYRMAIENDVRDREVWTEVAWSWYSKARDRNPNVGRLCHHLAILARPSSLHQISLFAISLTAITPFESAREGLFASILHDNESTYSRSSPLGSVFIKAHNVLLFNNPIREFDDVIHQLRAGLLDNHIDRAAARFKKHGVFAAVTNIAALFEYGAVKQGGLHKSIFRLAYQEMKQETPLSFSPSGDELSDDTNIVSIQSTFPSLTASDIKSSEVLISRASILTFTFLSVSLQRINDENVFPLVHASFVFIWSLASVERAMIYVERDVPWDEICSFLNALAKSATMTSRIWRDEFFKSSNDVDRPLPEDFIMRGQLYCQHYFPKMWFEDATIDNEERELELSSMSASRTKRILWLGIRIASVCTSHSGYPNYANIVRLV